MSLIKREIHKALNDMQLREAVLSSCRRSVEKRNLTSSEIDDYEAARRRARSIRQRSIDELESLHADFRKVFEAAGGQLHYAVTAAAACRIVVDLIRKAGARRGVKAKSMVTEEIGLGEALTHNGIDAIESDLGEFIVQLAGEPPSHITAPALHRSKESIGRLFAEKLGVSYTDDPVELTGIARSILRERFVKAEFGISGANFIAADTGHVVVVENEGNGRLGAALTPLFIAVTGIDKVIPSLHDLPPLLRLLPSSATGQRITSYVNLMLPVGREDNGSQEFHVVLVDNGRRRTIEDPLMREMLLCIRCGACLNICPIYRSVGGHVYRSVYPGPMGAVLSNLLGPRPGMHMELPFLSTLCGACREVCPVDIDLPRLLLELRARASKPLAERMAAAGWLWTMSSPARLELAGRMAKTTGRLFGGVLPTGGFVKSGMSFHQQAEKQSRIYTEHHK